MPKQLSPLAQKFIDLQVKALQQVPTECINVSYTARLTRNLVALLKKSKAYLSSEELDQTTKNSWQTIQLFAVSGLNDIANGIPALLIEATAQLDAHSLLYLAETASQAAVSLVDDELSLPEEAAGFELTEEQKQALQRLGL